MEKDNITYIIVLSSFSSIIFLCLCIRFYSFTYRENRENRLYNIRKKMKKRIKPINLTIDDEIKDKSEIRPAEENV